LIRLLMGPIGDSDAAQSLPLQSNDDLKAPAAGDEPAGDSDDDAEADESVAEAAAAVEPVVEDHEEGM